MYLASGDDAKGCSRPDIVAVNEAVGILDLPSLKTKLGTNLVAVFATSRAVGHNTVGSGAALWCGDSATSWNAKGSAGPDVVAVDEAVSTLDRASRQTEIVGKGVAGVAALSNVGHRAAAAASGVASTVVAGSTGRNANGGVGPDVIAVEERVGAADGG